MKEQNLYEITLTSRAVDRTEYWTGFEFRESNPGEILFKTRWGAESQFPAAVEWVKRNSEGWINAEFKINLNEMVYDEENEMFESEVIASEAFTPREA